MDRQFLSAMLFNLPKISDFAECLFILFRELFPLSVAIFLHPPLSGFACRNMQKGFSLQSGLG